MFQVAVYDTIYTDSLADTRHPRDKGTIATQHNVDRHSRSRCLIKLLHHHRVRNMVDLHPDICRLTHLLVAYFLINQAKELLLHFIGRHQKFTELYGRIRFFYEIEHIGHVRNNASCSRHQHIIRINAGVTLVEISRTDTSHVRSLLHADVRHFGMYLQPLDTKNDMHTRILHQFRPTDVGSLVKTSQQLYHDRHLLPVTGSINQRIHHLRSLCKPVQRGFYALDILADSRLLQHPYIIIETMIRHVNVPVPLLYQVQQAYILIQFLLNDRRPFRILQILPAAIGKGHQILMIVITPAGQYRIQLIQVQLVHHPLQHILGHSSIVYHTQGIPFPTAFDPFGNLL